MRSDPRLDQLVRLAALIREREIAKLAVLSKRRRALESTRADVRSQRSKSIDTAAPDPAHIAGADDPWLRWNRQKLKDLSSAAASAAAESEAQLAIARRAFGRAQALTRIKERSKR